MVTGWRVSFCGCCCTGAIQEERSLAEAHNLSMAEQAARAEEAREAAARVRSALDEVRVQLPVGPAVLTRVCLRPV